MINACEERKRQLAFELQNSRVFEKRGKAVKTTVITTILTTATPEHSKLRRDCFNVPLRWLNTVSYRFESYVKMSTCTVSEKSDSSATVLSHLKSFCKHDSVTTTGVIGASRWSSPRCYRTGHVKTLRRPKWSRPRP